MYAIFLHETEVYLNCNRLKRSGNYVTLAVTQTSYFATERFYVPYYFHSNKRLFS
jgi:hypothetical protein